jgi:hypothetical protein
MEKFGNFLLSTAFPVSQYLTSEDKLFHKVGKISKPQKGTPKPPNRYFPNVLIENL